MLKIFNECLNAINKCLKGLLDDGVLSVSQEFGSLIKPWQRRALDGIVEGGEITQVSGCHVPEVQVHGMPTQSMVLGLQYTKEGRQCQCSVLVVCNNLTEWASASLLDSHDESNNVIEIAYPHIGSVGYNALQALPNAA